MRRTGSLDEGDIFPAEMLGGKALPQHRGSVDISCRLRRLVRLDVRNGGLDIHQLFLVSRRKLRHDLVIAGLFLPQRTAGGRRIHQLFRLQRPVGQGLVRGMPDAGAPAVLAVFVQNLF